MCAYNILFLGMYSIFYLCVVACYALISVPYNGLIADKTPAAQRGMNIAIDSTEYHYIYVHTGRPRSFVAPYDVIMKFWSYCNHRRLIVYTL